MSAIGREGSEAEALVHRAAKRKDEAAPRTKKLKISLNVETARVEELSRRHFAPYAELKPLFGAAAYDEEELQRLECICERHRVAVIAGDPAVGKGTFARLVAARLSGASEPPRPVFETPPLAPEIHAPLRQLADGTTFEGGIWLFRDFLVTRHRDLQLFVDELNEVSLDSLGKHLTKAQAYLLLTSDNSHLEEGVRVRLDALGILHVTKGPESGQVLRLLQRKAEMLAQPPRADLEMRLEAKEIVDRKGADIVARLRTPPRVILFLERYLLKIAKKEITLDRALELAAGRVDHLAEWLLRDLVSDLETWAFALALVLAQPVPPHRGAPWLLVHELAQAIARHLRLLLREPRARGTVIEDEGRLDRLGAEVIRFPFPGWDVARFRDESYPEKLWRVLLGPGRELLSVLLPLLRRLAEDRSRSFETRSLAACALGRGGELDARAVIFPALAEWSRSEREMDDYRIRGHLLQGVLGSPPSSFSEACLRQMRQSVETAMGERAWAPALTLGTLAETELSLAIDGLVLLAHANLVGLDLNLDRAEEDELRRNEELFTAALKSLEGQAKSLDLVTPILCRDEEDPLRALMAVQYALVGLCLFHGPLTPLRELASRLVVHDGGRLVALPALLLWRQGGIVDVLEGDYALSLTQGLSWRNSVQGVASRFLAAAAAEPNGAEELAELLSGSYLQTGKLPGTFARYLRSRLRDRVREWVLQIAATAGQPDVWQAGRTLCSTLLRSRVSGLKEDIHLLLREDPELTRRGSRVARLANEAMAT
jgi:hypothetical protein